MRITEEVKETLKLIEVTHVLEELYPDITLAEIKDVSKWLNKKLREQGE